MYNTFMYMPPTYGKIIITKWCGSSHFDYPFEFLSQTCRFSHFDYPFESLFQKNPTYLKNIATGYELKHGYILTPYVSIRIETVNLQQCGTAQ